MSEPDSEIERLRKRLERERRVREEAESLAERGTRLLYERGQQMHLLYSVADASSVAESVEAAIQVALDALCGYAGWPIGHAWLVSRDPVRPLVSTKLWHLDHAEPWAEFRAASESLAYRRGQDLPGRVLAAAEPGWVTEVSADPAFSRARQALEIGLRGALAMPVLARNKVVAVLEFFSRETVAPEQSLLDLMTQVGIQVGRTFERQARDEADRANQAKSVFLSRMSHELRTPLNAILGFGQLLELDDLSPDQRVGVGHILKGGRHLLGLINEVLDISRIETGNMQVSPEAVRVDDVLREALELMTPLAAQRQIVINPARAHACRGHVRADRQRFKQILLNLLSNAIKYNRPGGSVNVDCAEINGRLRVNVSDTGIGISTEKLRQLFTPFERLGAENGLIEGTGLGLAISKRLAELMGGSIGVESCPDRGSTFWVEFAVAPSPLEAPRPSAASDKPPETQVAPQCTVLYIEDNQINLELVERLLTRRPHVRMLGALQAGLGLKLAAQHLPDLILLDLNLPDMDGQEVLVRLLSDAATHKIPIVVISADATPGQIARLLAAGAADYLTKPFDVPTFFAIIDRRLGEINLTEAGCA